MKTNTLKHSRVLYTVGLAILADGEEMDVSVDPAARGSFGSSLRVQGFGKQGENCRM